MREKKTEKKQLCALKRIVVQMQNDFWSCFVCVCVCGCVLELEPLTFVELD